MSKTVLNVEDWGVCDYRQAFDKQAHMVAEHLNGRGVDTLVLVEHPPTVTMGRRASESDLHFPEQIYSEKGVALQKINRGGLATAHEPGQLVAYPIIQLKKRDLRWFANCFLTVVINLLDDYGIRGHLKNGEPGVWVDGRKICSFGIALKKWVSSHGIALNVNNSLKTFSTIVPCGQPHEIVTSLSKEKGCYIDAVEMKQRFVQHFCQEFDYTQYSEK